MKTYLVGGAVRDSLLGRPIHDRDFVVTDCTEQDMLNAGFQKVGKDFPVFLHPETREEFALPRSARHDPAAAFVTLEEDLARRDLTINAIAQEADGTIVDPCGGVADLTARILRHAGPAFSEDPLRVFRVARFAAQFPQFSVAPETLAVMRQLRDQVAQLPADRVWKELVKGLATRHPSRMFEVLREVDCLAFWLPELQRLSGIPQPAAHHPEGCAWTHSLQAVDAAAQHQASLPARWAALVHDLGKGVTPPDQWPRHYQHEKLGLPVLAQVHRRLLVPKDFVKVATWVMEFHQQVHSRALRPGTVISLLVSGSALRDSPLFKASLEACAADARARNNLDEAYPQQDWWLAAANVVRNVNLQESIARFKDDPAKLPGIIHGERAKALRAWASRQ